MTSRIPMIIAMRGYAVPVRHSSEADASKPAKHQRKTRKTLPRPSDYTLVFDTETSTDRAQNLRFGTYQVRKGEALLESGLFHEPGNLSDIELALLKAHAHLRNLVVRSREEFVREVFYVYGYDRGGLILGFNLPFDLSRLAVATATSHGKDMRGGFSLTLLPEKWRPNVLVKHLNSRTAFMRFAASPGQVDARSMRKKGFKTQAKTGYFQDAKTLAAALLGRPFSLGSLAKLLRTPHQKIDTEEHGGPLTADYIDYAIADTQVTWECYVELRKLYDAHGLKETPPHRIYSEASLGKAYLFQMGIQPWTKLQPDFPADMLGIIMSTYYGGRAEVRIRRQTTRVLYCDFRSMYPSVCTLMGLWQFVIATGIDHEDWTAQTQMLLERVELQDMQRPNMWPFLTTLVQIHPDDDPLPVRARYGEDGRTIGLNHLSAEFGCWYTLADCVASKLLTGKSPRVLKAIRFSPRGRQIGLRPIALGGNNKFRIDPNCDDLYKRTIELRGQIQAAEESARAEGRIQEAELLGAYQQMLKLLANSTSYGIFAEMNVQSFDRPRRVMCYGTENAAFDTGSKSVEEPGTHFHPLLATLITGAARLMLAMAERVASDQGIGWALCDTDSLALARPEGMADAGFLERALAVTEWFDPLNPYDDDKPLFKVESQNFRLKDGVVVPGEHEPLFVFGISAKRYALFNLDANSRPVIRKALAHGLGHWRAPYREHEAPASIPLPSLALKDIGVDRWQHDLWHQIIVADLEGHPDQVDLSMLPHLDRRAASRYAATTSALLHWFDDFNADRPIGERVKPFNFLLAFQVSPSALYEQVALGKLGPELLSDPPPAAVAAFGSDTEAAARRAFDRHTGRPIPVEILVTYREALAVYHLHSESKFENGGWADRGVTERRHVQAIAVEYIGKEANRWEEQFYLGEADEAQIEYGFSRANLSSVVAMLRSSAGKLTQVAVAARAGISRQELAAIVDASVDARLGTLRRLVHAAAELLRSGG